LFSFPNKQEMLVVRPVVKFRDWAIGKHVLRLSPTTLDRQEWEALHSLRLPAHVRVSCYRPLHGHFHVCRWDKGRTW
jgi:hypothetical protein